MVHYANHHIFYDQITTCQRFKLSKYKWLWSALISSKFKKCTFLQLGRYSRAHYILQSPFCHFACHAVTKSSQPKEQWCFVLFVWETLLYESGNHLLSCSHNNKLFNKHFPICADTLTTAFCIVCSNTEESFVRRIFNEIVL